MIAIGPRGNDPRMIAEIRVERSPERTTEDASAEVPADQLEAEFTLVWRLLRRLGFSAEDAEDAAQDVCLVAIRRGAEVEQGKRRAFLRSTTLHVAATRRRTVARRRLAPEPLSDGHASPAPDPEALTMRRRRLEILDQILAGLPWELRVPFVLFELEELTASEVAEVLDIPVGTVASRVRRARQLFSQAAQRMRARERSGGGR